MANVYNTGKIELSTGGSTDWTADTIKALLVSSVYVYSSAHQFVNEVTANELANSGYARQTLTSKTVALDGSDVKITAANLTFSALGAGTTPDAVIIFRDTGNDATAPLLAYNAFDGAQDAPNGTDYSVTLPATGLIRLTDT
jgi:hypothetical protein